MTSWIARWGFGVYVGAAELFSIFVALSTPTPDPLYKLEVGFSLFACLLIAGAALFFALRDGKLTG
jgi:hypothetical protein